MAVNANLLASIGQNMPSPMEGVEKAYRLKDLMNREQASSIGLDTAKSGMAQDAAIKSIAEKSDLTTTEGQMAAASEIAKVDPKKGMDFMRTIQELQQGKGALEKQKYELLSEQNDIVTNAAAGLATEYDSLVQRGMPPAQAAGQMQPKYLQTIQQLAGLKLSDGTPALSQQHKDMLSQNAMFNPDTVRSWATQGAQGREALRMQLAFHQGERLDAQAAETARHNQAMEKAAATKADAEKDKNFTPEEGTLMAALAERGVSLPTGFRSKEQQKVLYDGILRRNPEKTPEQIADLIALGQIEFGAQKKETQTAAAVVGRVGVAVNELEEFIPLVREASAAVPRGKFVPLTKLFQMADREISDPNLRALKVRINSTLNAYDMLAARGGTDMAKREEVRNLLMASDSPEVLESALKSFELEAAAAKRAAVRATKVQELPDHSAGAPSADGKPNTKGWTVRVLDDKKQQNP